MPEQTTVSKPSLYGGISKQPAHLRHPSQVEDALNSDFTPGFGASKRPGTKLVANLGTVRFTVTPGTGSLAVGDTFVRQSGSPTYSGVVVAKSDSGNQITAKMTSGTLTTGTTLSVGGGTKTATVGTIWAQWASGTKLRLHPIFRDRDEIYLLVQGPATSSSPYPRIVPVTSVLGKEAVLSAGSGSPATYLALNNPTAADFRYCTVLDYTYIANSTVAMEGDNTTGAIDQAKYPYTIKRTSTSPLTFEFANETLETRGSRGSSSTNPLLPFFGGPPNSGVGNKVADLCLFQDRLVIAAGTYIGATQTGSLTDYWYDLAGTPPAVVDSDPVVVRTPGPSATFLDRLCPLRRSIIASAVGSRQFELTTTGDTFSPSSASFTPSTALNATNGLALTPFQTGILFFVKSRDTGSVHYYVYDDAQIAYTSLPLSSHVEGLIPPNATRVVADTNSGFIGVITNESYRNFYTMRMAYEGGRLVQTAWSVWNFSGPNDVLLDAAIINGVLYILLESEGSYLIEGMPLGSTFSATTETVLTGSSISDSGESIAADA